MRVDTHIWFLANQDWDNSEAIELALDVGENLMMKSYAIMNDYHKPHSLWYPDPVVFATTRLGSHLEAFLWSQRKKFRFHIVAGFDPYTIRAQDVVILGPGTDEKTVGIFDTAKSRGCTFVDVRKFPYVSSLLN